MPNPSQPATGRNPQADLIAHYISENKVMLTNALLPDILEKLRHRGYTQESIQRKLAALEELRRLNEVQRREYGEQYQSTADYNTAVARQYEDYKDHMDYARLVFKANPAAQTALGLTGRRHRSQSGYAAQALLFYNNLLNNSEWKAAMATKGVREEELADQREAYQNLEHLEAAQQKETGEAQAATAMRDAAHDALEDWLLEFRETARIALRRYPQLSEKLGIKDPS